MNCPRCNAPANEETLREFGGVCPKCLLQFSEEQDAPAFPNLEIVEMIGQGGMGVVYKARQKNLDRIVALKVLSPHLSEDPEFVERFTREAKALAQLNHPNIVGIHDSGIHDRVPYLVMEYIDGTPLRGVLASGKLTPARALEVIPQICDALQYAHANGIVHRDIKPENILIDRQGRVKIADFGLAKLSVEQSKLTQSGFVMGTPRYMAPEQFEPAGRVDHRADIYSLGVVFYEMLTGEVPMGRFKPPSAKADVDQRLDPVVLKSLEREPEDRYQSANEVKDQVAGLKVPPKPERRKPLIVRTPSPLKRAAFVLANIGGLLVGASLILALLKAFALAGIAGQIGISILFLAFAVWLVSVIVGLVKRNAPPAPPNVQLERTQIGGCLLALVIGGVLFLALAVLLFFGRSAPPAPAVVTVPAPAVIVGGGSRFHLEDAWPKPEDLPSGLRLESVVEGKAVLPPPKPKTDDEIVRGGNLADAIPDLKLIRKATLAEGRVILWGFEFKTDYARKRWEKELRLLPVDFADGKALEGRSLFHIGPTDLKISPAAQVAIEMMIPILQRKMKEAAANYRD